MASLEVVPARTDIPAAAAPSSVKRLDVVAVSFFNHAHQVFSTLAHVLAVGPVDENTGQPTLSLAYPDPQASDRTLTGPKWYEGYKREVGVQHASHPDVKDGRLSAAWAQPMSPRIEDLPAHIPTPEGSAARPYFERQVPAEVEKASIEQNLAVQRGLAPAGTVIPPTVNEPETGSAGVAQEGIQSAGTTNSASDTPGGTPAAPEAVTQPAETTGEPEGPQDPSAPPAGPKEGE